MSTRAEEDWESYVFPGTDDQAIRARRARIAARLLEVYRRSARS